MQGSQALGVPPDDHTCIHKRIQGDPHPWCYQCIAKYGKTICQRDDTCDLCRNIDSTIWRNILKSRWKMECQSPSKLRPLTELEADSALGSTGIGFPLTPDLDSRSDSEEIPIPMTQRYINSPSITEDTPSEDSLRQQRVYKLTPRRQMLGEGNEVVDNELPTRGTFHIRIYCSL